MPRKSKNNLKKSLKRKRFSKTKRDMKKKSKSNKKGGFVRAGTYPIKNISNTNK